MELLEEDEDLEGGARVEVARSLIGQDDGGIVDQGTRNGDALHLTTRHLVGLMVKALPQPHSLQGSHGTVEALLLRDAGVVHQRQFDVFHARGLGQKVVVLKDEADLAVAQDGTLRLRHRAHGHTIEEVVAAGGRVEAAQLIEEG